MANITQIQLRSDPTKIFDIEDSQARQDLLGKVDKVTGKGLSTNDYTDADKAIVDGVETALNGKVDKNGTDRLMTAAEGTKLEGIAAGAEVNVQADWEEDDTTSDAYIANKPSIPAAQVNADWDAVSGVAEILNKPTLGTAAALDVAESGDATSAQVVKGNDSRLTDDRNAADVYAWAKAATKPAYTAVEVGAIDATEKGANSGVATLDATGKVPSSQLPSYVDDVLEYASTSAFPAEGEGGKIYVALDTNKTYRWGGTEYVEISESLALGETQGTAYEGSKGKANADAISDIQGLIPSTATTSNKLATADDIPDITDKADKVASATSGNFAGLDANGNLTDSGSKASDFLTSADISGKQNKTLDTAITVDGTQQTTVEGALGAINTLAAANKTAIGGIKDGTSIDSFADVEAALPEVDATNGILII